MDKFFSCFTYDVSAICNNIFEPLTINSKMNNLKYDYLLMLETNLYFKVINY